MMAVEPKAAEFLPIAVTRSTWIQRLARITFLGTLDYQPDCGRSTTRLDHSYGVVELAKQIVLRWLGCQDASDFLLACLLHDVGHFPFSHSADEGFVTALKVDHHGLA